ncbi:MAG: DUF2892 domain-containing protein [Deltaproteobacteria bacterium]|nr:DUF2892 domain-containing protein [Deltaproteobacteria bacterium]
MNIHMKCNVGKSERAMRIFFGAMLICLAFIGLIPDAAGIMATVVGTLSFFTGAISYCPMYDRMGMDTSKPKQGTLAT